jgi:hypothetical protein
MKKYATLLILAVLVLLAMPTSGQQHALTQDQCRADRGAWAPPSSSWAPGDLSQVIKGGDASGVWPSSNADMREIQLRWEEMEECRQVDLGLFDLHPDPSYAEVKMFYSVVIARRMRDFLDRNHLWEQFLQEDKQGKR